MNLKQLKNRLERAHINYSTWTTRKTKTLGDLLSKINRKEAKLQYVNGGLACFMTSAIVDTIFRRNDTVVEHLKEDHRKFRDGDVEYCSRSDGIGKKMRIGEDRDKAARRCIRQKLRFRGPLRIKYLGTRHITTSDSGMFPGLPLIYRQHMFRYSISKKLFNPLGYERKRRDRTTFFHWFPRQGT